jgi:hypothetical protein
VIGATPPILPKTRHAWIEGNGIGRWPLQPLHVFLKVVHLEARRTQEAGVKKALVGWCEGSVDVIYELLTILGELRSEFQ